MKIPQDIQAKVARIISPLDTPERRHKYICGDFPRAAVVHDLDMRYRWDLMWHSGAQVPLMEWLTDVGLAQQVNDSHIDTMLRRIVPTLGQEEEAS